jgi:hypothetical protein
LSELPVVELRTEYTRNAVKQYLSRITDENPVYIETLPDTATAYTVLPDINGNDAVLIKFVIPTMSPPSNKAGWQMLRDLRHRRPDVYSLPGKLRTQTCANAANRLHWSACDARADPSLTKTPEAPPITEELLI